MDISNKLELITLVKDLYKEINKISNIYLQFDDINLSQRNIIEQLYNDTSLTVPQIAKIYNVSRQHVQINVNSLLEKGLVIQEKNSLHKRSKLIVLTKKGKTLFDEIVVFEQRFISELFYDVSNKDIDRTKDILANVHVKAKGILEAISS